MDSNENNNSNSIENNSTEYIMTSTSTGRSTTTTLLYEEKTEINLEQSISLQEVGCGKIYGSSVGVNEHSSTGRVASDVSNLLFLG